MNTQTQLRTTKDVIEALGGTTAVAELTGRSYRAAFNWRGFQTFPANTFLKMRAALDEKGELAPPSLWGME
jgi:hypothetical protein